MGMYDDVYKKHQDCELNGIGYSQTKALDCTLSTYDLDDLEDLAERLTEAEMMALLEDVQDDWFECQECGESFKPFKRHINYDNRLKKAKELFG